MSGSRRAGPVPPLGPTGRMSDGSDSIDDVPGTRVRGPSAQRDDTRGDSETGVVSLQGGQYVVPSETGGNISSVSGIDFADAMPVFHLTITQPQYFLKPTDTTPRTFRPTRDDPIGELLQAFAATAPREKFTGGEGTSSGRVTEYGSISDSPQSVSVSESPPTGSSLTKQSGTPAREDSVPGGIEYTGMSDGTGAQSRHCRVVHPNNSECVFRFVST